MAKKGGWTAFPHDNSAFVYDGAALKKNWARLHKGDAEPYPTGATDKAVEEAWRLYHAGDFEPAARPSPGLQRMRPPRWRRAPRCPAPSGLPASWKSWAPPL